MQKNNFILIYHNDIWHIKYQQINILDDIYNIRILNVYNQLLVWYIRMKICYYHDTGISRYIVFPGKMSYIITLFIVDVLRALSGVINRRQSNLSNACSTSATTIESGGKNSFYRPAAEPPGGWFLIW